MNRKLLTRVVAGASLLASSTAALAYTYIDDNGRRVECVDETVTTTKADKDKRALGTVGGAVVGGVIGHQFGSGKGNDAATAAGAIGGGVVGNKATKGDTKTETKVESHCRPAG